jgi:hypothetical protein
MKIFIKGTLLIAGIVGLSSCGGGGSCPTTEVLAIEATCSANHDLSSYISLQSGDIITKEELNTTINIFHDQDNQKVVCIESGKASIIRSS